VISVFGNKIVRSNEFSTVSKKKKSRGFLGLCAVGREPIACPFPNRQMARRQETGRGEVREGYKYRSTRYRSRSRVVDDPLRLGPRLWIQSPAFALSSWSHTSLVPAAVSLWRPLPRVQGPRAERLGRSLAISALFPCAVVVLVFSNMSGLMLESGALSSP
jgi:hypothetical protein